MQPVSCLREIYKKFSSRNFTEDFHHFTQRMTISGMKEPRLSTPLLLTLVLITILQGSIARQHGLRIMHATTKTPDCNMIKGNYTNSSRNNDSFTDNSLFSNNRTSTRPMNPFQMVGYVVVPTFLALGLFGNTMTIFVMRYSLFSSTSVAIVVVALSLSDTVLILMAPFNRLFIQRYLRIDIRALHWLGCKAFFWFWRTAKMTSSWFMVLIALERLVVKIRPRGAENLFTKRYASVGIMFVCLLAIAYTTGFASISDGVRRSKCVYGLPDNRSHGILIRNLSLGMLCLYTFIPIAFALFLCLISVCMARRHNDPECVTMPGENEASDKEGVSEKLSSMLFGVVIIFCNLLIPVAVLHVLPMAHPASTSTMPFVIFRIVAETLEELNYSIKFYVYLISSCFFRAQLADTFGCSRPASNSHNMAMTSEDDESPEKGTSAKKPELNEDEEVTLEDPVVEES